MSNEPLSPLPPSSDPDVTDASQRFAQIVSSPYLGVVIGCIVLIGIVAGVLWYSLRDVMSPPSRVDYPSVTPVVDFPAVSSTGATPKNEAQINSDYYNSALKRNDPSLCDRISQDEMRIECQDNLIIKKATDQKDVSLCAQITTLSMKYSCQNPLIFAEALEKQDQSLCQKIEGNDRSKQDCISRIAVNMIASASGANISRSQCDVISDDRLKASCVDQVVTKLSNAQYIQAQATLDMGACQSIEDAALRSTCLDELILKKARSSQDPALCATISYSSKRESCISEITSRRDEKIFIQARDKKDVSLCATITDAARRDRCHDTITITRATIENNPLVCDGVRDEQKKIQCRQLF